MEEKNAPIVEDNSTGNAKAKASCEKNECRCGKKLSGDFRTFVIALLTSVIVVLVYHGILMAVRCAKAKECKAKKICLIQQQMPRKFDSRKFSKHHMHRRPQEFKCERCEKKTNFREMRERKDNRRQHKIRQQEKAPAENAE